MQLFVIGMHRSGTSAVARCLNLLGAYFGPENSSMGANPENPKGFWERRDVRGLNDRLLHSVAADWDRMADFSIEKIPAEEKARAQKEIASLLLELDAHRPWLIKEPRLSLVFPVWRPLLEMPVCIHVHRHPLEIAFSLRKRNNFSIPLGIALWETYVLAGFAATSGLPRLIISYRDLLDSPWETVCDVAAELRKLGVNGLIEPSRNEIEAFIEPELYHHRTVVAEPGYLHGAQCELLEMIESKAILERAPDALPALSSSAIDVLTAHEIISRQVAELKDRLQQMEEGQGVGSVSIAVLRKERDKLREKVIAKEKTVEDRSWKFSSVLNELRKERDKLREKVIAREKTLEDRSWKFSSVLNELKRTVEKQKGQISQRNQQMDERRAWTAMARAAIEKRDQKIKKDGVKLVAAEGVIDAQTEQIAELKSQIERLEGSRQTVEARWQEAQERWRKDFTELTHWSERLAGEFRQTLASKQYRIGCWLGLKRGGAHNKEAQRFAHLLATKPQAASNEASSTPGSDYNSKKEETEDAESGGAGAVIDSLAERGAVTLSIEGNDNSQASEMADAGAGGVDARASASLSKHDPPPSQAPAPAKPRSPESPTGNTAKGPTQSILDIKVDVIVCIHNALDDLRRCLSSITAHPSAHLNQLLLINDGSAQATIDYLEAFAAESKMSCRVIHRPAPGGYTQAANCGLRASEADYAILLNSDTIVTSGWIGRLIACGESDTAIGIIGPLSNAASWQSVPHRFGRNGDWAVNELPLSALSRTACLFTILKSPTYPKVPLVNGFCFAIKRGVITAIGLFDEALFPNGYGEENDYCLRARRAGFKAAIADDCYVYHAKSRSYTHETRRALGKQAQALLRQKYGSELEEATDSLRHSAELARARSAFAQLLETQPCHTLFLLNFRSVGGGTNSIVQEASGLRDLGAAVQIAIRSADEGFYRERFPNAPGNLFWSFDEMEELIAYGGNFEFVVATLFTGVRLLQQVVERFPAVIPCYYIQDYEPSFFHRSDLDFAEAVGSYTLIPAMKRFAKTRWLCETVEKEQGVPVYKVEPSIDHGVFYPDDSAKPGIPFVVCAMVRPMTERRSPGLTLEILDRIKREFGRKVEIRIFGLEPDDTYLHRQYSDYQHRVLGILTREAVAELMRKSSLFIDASAYQAFGRTGLEAMACGCATILPRGGGIDEYAVDGVNTLLAIPEDASDFLEKTRLYIQDTQLYQGIVEDGLKTAARFSIERACLSELKFFTSLRPAKSPAGLISSGSVSPPATTA